MKKALIIIGVVLAVVGLVICLAVLVQTQFNINAFRTEQYAEKSFDKSVEHLNEISIDNKNTQVDIRESADNLVHIRYSESEYATYTVTLDGGTLTIVEHSQREWYQYLIPSFSHNKPAMTVEIPRGVADTLEVETSNGSIEIRGIELSGAVSLTTDNGSIIADSLACASAAFKTDNGRISVEDISAETIEMTTKNGAIDMDGVSAKKLQAQIHNGAISFDGIDAQEIVLTSKNGKIDGTVAGAQRDYTLSISSHNGHCSPSGDSGSGTRTLTATTNNGAVTISFADGN